MSHSQNNIVERAENLQTANVEHNEIDLVRRSGTGDPGIGDARKLEPATTAAFASLPDVREPILSRLPTARFCFDDVHISRRFLPRVSSFIFEHFSAGRVADVTASSAVLSELADPTPFDLCTVSHNYLPRLLRRPKSDENGISVLGNHDDDDDDATFQWRTAVASNSFRCTRLPLDAVAREENADEHVVEQQKPLERDADNGVSNEHDQEIDSSVKRNLIKGLIYDHHSRRPICNESHHYVDHTGRLKVVGYIGSPTSSPAPTPTVIPKCELSPGSVSAPSLGPVGAPSTSSSLGSCSPARISPQSSEFFVSSSGSSTSSSSTSLCSDPCSASEDFPSTPLSTVRRAYVYKRHATHWPIARSHITAVDYLDMGGVGGYSRVNRARGNGGKYGGVIGGGGDKRRARGYDRPPFVGVACVSADGSLNPFVRCPYLNTYIADPAARAADHRRNCPNPSDICGRPINSSNVLAKYVRRRYSNRCLVNGKLIKLEPVDPPEIKREPVDLVEVKREPVDLVEVKRDPDGPPSLVNGFSGASSSFGGDYAGEEAAAAADKCKRRYLGDVDNSARLAYDVLVGYKLFRKRPRLKPVFKKPSAKRRGGMSNGHAARPSNAKTAPFDNEVREIAAEDLNPKKKAAKKSEKKKPKPRGRKKKRKNQNKKVVKPVKEPVVEPKVINEAMTLTADEMQLVKTNQWLIK